MGFFAYPRRKVQSRISSRLENEPLSLLSVFIDNMHVDEVQIDGGGTEAVITGNMENPDMRLMVLEGDEVETLYRRSTGVPPSHTKSELNTSPFKVGEGRLEEGSRCTAVSFEIRTSV
jgi:hypothetical protein